jgi:hypothetical protein
VVQEDFVCVAGDCRLDNLDGDLTALLWPNSAPVRSVLSRFLIVATVRKLKLMRIA